jgi:hypothetical protein
MKNTFKTILLLLILISALSACRKDAPAHSQTIVHDFRDTFVGNYQCEMHKMYYQSFGLNGSVSYDSLKGSAIISVGKSLTSDGLIVDGNQYDLIYYQDSTGITYVSQTDLNSYGTLIHFNFQNDSILMDTNSQMGTIFFHHGYWTEYRGSKIH